MKRTLLTAVIWCIAYILFSSEGFASSVEYLKQESNKPGPVVAVVGLSAESGNAGIRAALQIAHWEITRGALIVVLDEHRNPALLKQRRARLGKQSRWGESVEQVLQDVNPDWVIQLTESFDAHSIIAEASGAQVLGRGDAAGMSRLLSKMSAASQGVGTNDEPRWNSRQIEALSADSPNEIVVITSAKDPRARREWYRTRQQRAAVQAFLSNMEMRSADSSHDELMPADRADGTIWIALYQGPGAVSSSGHDPVWIQQTLDALPDFQTALIGPDEIQSGGLSRFDVFVVGGGLSNRQARGLGAKGREQIVRFVESGGGYVGICAGMFLASSDSDSRLHLLPIDVAGSSGVGKVKLDFQADTEIGVRGNHPAKFSGGPVNVSKLRSADESVKILAWFRSEPKDKKTSQTLTGTPAIVSGRHGRGRVFLFSPHCERYPGPRSAFHNAIRWAAGSEPSN